MTTIAFKADVMACDSAWWYGESLATSQTKIVRLASGALLGEAGDADSRELRNALNRVRKPADLPPRADLEALRLDYTGLLVFPNGERWFITIDESTDRLTYKAQCYPIMRPFCAAGSGADAALCLMIAGFSAEHAIQTIIREGLDKNTRGKVHTVPLRQPRRRGKT